MSADCKYIGSLCFTLAQAKAHTHDVMLQYDRHSHQRSEQRFTLTRWHAFGVHVVRTSTDVEDKDIIRNTLTSVSSESDGV